MTANVAKDTSTVHQSEGIAPSNSDMHVEYAENASSDMNRVGGNLSAGSNANGDDSGSSKYPPRPGVLRRKSTILLEDHDMDEEAELKKLRENADDELTPLSRVVSGEEVELNNKSQQSEASLAIDTLLEWKQGGKKVYVTGSFTGWRKMIKLHRNDNNTFSTTIKLPPGTHRLRFVVDNELLCSNYLSTATDSMGNLVNYIEIEPGVKGLFIPGQQQLPSRASIGGQNVDMAEAAGPGDGAVHGDVGDAAMGEVLDENKYERFNDDDMPVEPELEYCNDIPEVFTDSEAMDRFVSSEFVNPPQLPPHLEGVILNSNYSEKDNNSVLPIPNHVVLNHLATTSIKHNVLAVASISRYSRKYVTQILYAPLG